MAEFPRILAKNLLQEASSITLSVAQTPSTGGRWGFINTVGKSVFGWLED